MKQYANFHTHREGAIWLAGLLEGEGTFVYQYEQGRRASFEVSVASRDSDVIKQAHEVVGYGRCSTSVLLDRPFYHWRCWGKEAYAVMMLVFPFLGERRRATIANAVRVWRSVPLNNAVKTHCKHGHEFTPSNTIRNPSEPGRRRCRICLNRYQRELSQRKQLQDV